MIKMLYHLFFKPVKPYVGMKLECGTWGREFTEMEITNVSKNEKAILYKFNVCKGSNITSGDSYTASWPYILDTYDVIEEDECKKTS